MQRRFPDSPDAYKSVAARSPVLWTYSLESACILNGAADADIIICAHCLTISTPPPLFNRASQGKTKKKGKTTPPPRSREDCPIWLAVDWRKPGMFQYMIDAPAAVKIPSRGPRRRSFATKSAAIIALVRQYNCRTNLPCPSHPW